MPPPHTVTEAHELFDWRLAERVLGDAVQGADDGELYLEDSVLESFRWDDERLVGAGYSASQGFGLRVVAGECAGYGSSSLLTEAALHSAAATAVQAKRGYHGRPEATPAVVSRPAYAADNPLLGPGFGRKTDLLAEIDAYLRAKDPLVVQVAVGLRAEREAVTVLRPDGRRLHDARPLVQLSITVTVERAGRRESGFSGSGGRGTYDLLLGRDKWQAVADEAHRIARVNLEAVQGPVGEMDVVIGPGWAGVMLHEAVGHGLEGDFNRKALSAYSGRVGERVAAPGVTVVDDGSLAGRIGSLTMDDEGTPTQRNVLIENGILKGYMQDRMNARLMGVAPTGNARRQSYMHAPMPRMTNTFLEAGPHHPQEILSSLKRGIYVVTLGGGQVDITNGKFVFQCDEGYRVEDGRLVEPIKGVTLIGDGPRAMQGVTMIGNDLSLDPGIGTCGKSGQTLPAGVGQPTVYVKGLTVGGM